MTEKRAAEFETRRREVQAAAEEARQELVRPEEDPVAGGKAGK